MRMVSCDLCTFRGSNASPNIWCNVFDFIIARYFSKYVVDCKGPTVFYVPKALRLVFIDFCYNFYCVQLYRNLIALFYFPGHQLVL